MAIHHITTATDDSYLDVVLDTADKQHPYIEIDTGSYEREGERNALIFDETYARDLSKALLIMADELERYKKEHTL